MKPLRYIWTHSTRQIDFGTKICCQILIGFLEAQYVKEVPLRMEKVPPPVSRAKDSGTTRFNMLPVFSRSLFGYVSKQSSRRTNISRHLPPELFSPTDAIHSGR
jgi:hypothetical protein